MSDTDKKIAEIKDGIGMLTSCTITIKRLVKEKEALVNQLKECREEIDRPLLSDGEFNEAQMKREIEQRTKEACFEKALNFIVTVLCYGMDKPGKAELRRAIDSAKING